MFQGLGVEKQEERIQGFHRAEPLELDPRMRRTMHRSHKHS